MNIFVVQIDDMPEEYVILVDENVNELGSMEKIEAHEKAVLHRCGADDASEKGFIKISFARFMDKYMLFTSASG